MWRSFASNIGASSLAVALLGLAACSTTFTPQTCAVDTDCGDTHVCELREGAPVCVSPDEAPLIIGQSAPQSGVNQALGLGMKNGILLAFKEQNAKGGIRGRQLQLDFLDDEYDPLNAEMNAMKLVDAQPTSQAPKCINTATPVSNGATPPVLVPVSTTAIDRGPNAVLAMLGNVGTPTAIRAAPVAIESGTLFFGAFTGSQTLLRDQSSGACAKYIFNVRASYYEEATATLGYFVKNGMDPDYRNMISFDQNDTFGQAGYNGLTMAYAALTGAVAIPGNVPDPANPIQRVRYTRNDPSTVAPAVLAAENYVIQRLQATSGPLTIGIQMTDVYGAGSQFITSLRKWQFDGQNDAGQGSGSLATDKATRVKFLFSNVSFVGPNSLSTSLVAAGTVPNTSPSMPYTQDVIVSNVVPNYQGDQSAVVVQYNALIAATTGATPDFTSLEGYISGRVFVGGLLAHTGPFTPDSLVDSFNNLPDLQLGIGATVGFSADNHQYSNTVWGTRLEANGTFSNVYVYTNGGTIQFF